ncbi:MAG: hypothetical protein KBT27_09210 [Prevotellaceae bacterium]|nr:hypothetical protein [Candidatus Faecinaster equi]
MIKTRLTTPDNPFNPFTQFEDWYRYDHDHDYGTCDYLARFTFTSESLSEAENEEEISRAIDFILEHDPRKMYIKVTSSDEQIETKETNDGEDL